MGGLFGGGSSQQTTQQSTTTQESVTNAQHTNNFTATINGLQPGQVSDLLDRATAPTQDLATVLAGVGQGSNGGGAGGSALVYIIVLLMVAAIIFRR